jgi:DNA polymerase III epsilon subunit-like protein
MSMTICAIDTETTGLDISSDIVEISIVPTKIINKEFVVDKDIRPFSVLVNPGIESLNNGSEALSFNKIGRDTIIKDGIPTSDLYPMIQGWMMANGITKIKPLAQNWAFDSKLIEKTFSREKMEKIIYHRALDSLRVAEYWNNVFEIETGKPLFQSTSLTSLAKYFNISAEGAHRATNDCVLCIRVYNELMKMLYNINSPVYKLFNKPLEIPNEV